MLATDARSIEAAAAPTVRLQVSKANKTFGAARVLRDVDLEVGVGEVHALVGQNGSGKSTLIKILSGHYGADSGEIRVDDTKLKLPVRLADLRRTGVSVLHQDFGLVDEFSVVENIRINNFAAGKRSRAINWAREREVVRGLLRELNCGVDPDVKVGALGPVDRARVAIARSLQVSEVDGASGLRLLVFDESTRALPKDALDQFYDEIRSLVAGGTSVLLVSHNLEEVVRAADRVTVLRDGAVVTGGLPTQGTSERDLIGLMLGYALHERGPARGTHHIDSSSVAVSVVGASGLIVDGVDLALHPGEIVGLTGLEGSGFEELPYLITGAVRARAGTMTVSGRTMALTAGSSEQFIDAGVYLVPERREADGLALGESILSNVTLPRVRQRGSRFALGRQWQMDETLTAIDLLGIVPRAPHKPVGHLSGGNQQKVQLAKWLLGNARLMVVHEPTQGVDVGARRDIVEALVRLTATGVTVVVATMELELLEELCNRVAIFRDGRIDSIVDEVSVQKLIDTVYHVPSQGRCTTPDGQPDSTQGGD